MMTEDTMPNDELLELEKSLRSRLYPIQPDQKFVGSLLMRLEQESQRDDERRLAISFLTIAVGLVTGLAVFLLGQIIFKRSKKNVQK
ncbi:MAG: hypothetical protein SVP52_05185 [Chloroflexota bacterium]|nr:hypothetical protein [Chloroflexota bacterium]